ncbi:MAG: hypothetical protein IJZ89_03925 [Clostridia bacterium]|nr:hypothetical protein [Clostridia bacterium]
MTNNEIYRAVLHVLAETDEMASNSDYEERFPYILALFCGEAEDLDGKYRLSKGLPRALYQMRVAADMEEEFPLSDVFAGAAIYYAASLLIVDENPEFSDRLFEKYGARMTAIYEALPCEMGKIKNIYF